jgi:hypothetical protein
MPIHFTVERSTARRRSLTIVTDRPMLSLGVGIPTATATDGYDFAVLQIEIDARNRGGGTLWRAAKVKLNKGAFVVDDYASGLVRVTCLTKLKRPSNETHEV